MATMAHELHDVHLYRMSLPEHECPWGLKAIALMHSRGIGFRGSPAQQSGRGQRVQAAAHVATTPQIFSGDRRIGGYSDLAAVLGEEAEGATYSYHL